MAGLCSFKPTTTYLRCYYICIALIRNYSSFLRKEMTPAVERRLPRLEMCVMPGLDTSYKRKLPICLWNVIHCVLDMSNTIGCGIGIEGLHGPNEMCIEK